MDVAIHQDVDRWRISLLISFIMWASSEPVNSSSSISFRLELLMVPLLMLSSETFFFIFTFPSEFDVVNDELTSVLKINVHLLRVSANEFFRLSGGRLTGSFSLELGRPFFGLTQWRLLSRLSVVVDVCWLQEKFIGSLDGFSLTADL